ncbi:tRNA uridine-5-carboxymethylaminomethyl(34) synthesis GTPase MnmE [Candidatus Hepatincolaceae symbiont of Richtersius coronifer]
MAQYTIFALSTPFVKSAIAVIRVSGPNALESLKQISKKTNFVPTHFFLSNIYDAQNQIIDQPLIVYFPEGKSYTGENLVEYHVHGSLAVIKDLLDFLASCPDHRTAYAGEFTRRALENGKIDLLQAEGIADLINSQTSYQRKQSLKELQGETGVKYENWYNQLKEILALFEATLDFSDQDLPDDIFSKTYERITNLIKIIELEMISGKKIKKLKSGISIAIVGSPNVGKSSLLNYLTDKDTSIVSHIPGTTRDVIESFLDIGGFPVVIADTAGIRLTQDVIEAEGVKRALSRLKESDIILVILDITDLYHSYKLVDEFIYPILAFPIAEENLRNYIFLINKIDLEIKGEKKLSDDFMRQIKAQILEKNLAVNPEIYFVSIKDKLGLENFKLGLINQLEQITGFLENPVITQQRHSEIINACLSELKETLGQTNAVILAFYLRRALQEIGRILGKVDIEDILGIIFGKFCIGK